MSIRQPSGLVYLTSWIAFCLGLVAMTVDASAQDAIARFTDPSGTWRWEYELDGAQYKDLVRLKIGSAIKDTKDKEVTGVYEGSAGRKIEIRNGKISGPKLTFDFNLNYQGMDVKLEFEGTIAKDELTGTIHASANEGSRDLPWNATRSVKVDDVVGSWKMRIDAGGTILEPVVTITKNGDTLKASYVSVGASGEEVVIDAKDVKIEKNQLYFGVETEFQGTNIKADYKGRPYGDKIDGTIDYVLGSNEGVIDFTGVRQPETK